MENFVGPIIEIVKSVGGPIVRYLKYQIKFNGHLEQFNARKQRLCSRKGDIKSILDTQLHYGKVAKEEVQTWLEEAEEFIAKDIAAEVNGWGCLSCCCRVKVLQERARELQEIYERGDSLANKCLVKDDPSTSGVKLPASELQGSGDVKEEILACLMGDEVTKLGVWGMGGVGKTTIMENVHNELLKEAKFKKIIWATVSQPFDIYKLQEQIASTLKEEDTRKHPNATVRAGMLLKVLQRHMPYLLILDDVWESFELTAVGIPEPLKGDGCKLVLTTRSQEVARGMDCEIIEVKTLPKGEALKLFINKVGDIVLSDQGCIKGALESTLEGIVDECDGLPLAIVTVAGSLKRVSEPRLWSAALNQLKECKRKVAGTNDDDAFGILKFSYDRLESSKFQHCFLCCALYPEDHNIPIHSIIDYWIDEELIDEKETVQAMEDDGLYILRKLVDNCLLESNKVFEHDCVRMHDLVRDMALQITKTSPRFMIEAGKALTKLPEKGKWTEELEKVSLMWNRIEEIPSSILSSKCTSLTTLLLSHNNLSTISESVFEHMPSLKILDLSHNWLRSLPVFEHMPALKILNLSHNFGLRSLPSSISKLVNLTTLLLQGCRSLTEVPSFSEFGALKKLDLDETTIKEVPKGLEMCTNLKYLSLRKGQPGQYCSILDDATLLNLSKLQQLFVDERIALRGEVIGRLEKLEAFHGRFPTAHDWSNFLKCFYGKGDQLSRYSVAVRKYAYVIRHKGYRRVELHGIDIVGENIILPPSADGLCIGHYHNLRSLNDFSSIKDATDLRSCNIEGCEGMECVFSSWINPLVQTLEQLHLDELVKLEGLFDAEMIAMSPPPPPGTFSSLKSIRLVGCGKIKTFIPSWMLLRCLQSLEQIDVQNCEEIEEIIASDPEEEGGDIIKELIVPKLNRLILCRLPALKSICSRRAVMVCDSLQTIIIDDCTCLRRIPLFLPLFDNAQSSPRLKQINLLPQEWWESSEWDHPNAKEVIRRMSSFYR
ncbi:hypothetical protein SLEP1_g41164 [Rubroshorea leprosula]|uniref:Uncharacterized protein n=1 Tax=Rubroshorea leprosula TaxID=152421 RepID=A0AAV5L5S5_9ROSI|nr:hypothetical protein SLEP1_g41164 [Rubroshorea leprosula]